jgi:hypothetical protein
VCKRIETDEKKKPGIENDSYLKKYAMSLQGLGLFSLQQNYSPREALISSVFFRLFRTS